MSKITRQGEGSCPEMGVQHEIEGGFYKERVSGGGSTSEREEHCLYLCGGQYYQVKGGVQINWTTWVLL